MRLDTYLRGRGHVIQTSRPGIIDFLVVASCTGARTLSFADVVCTSLEPDPLVVNTTCIGSVQFQLSRMCSRLSRTFLHVPYVDFSYH